MNAKKEYVQPTLTHIEIDHQISLALESIPPFGPEEVHLSTDPFKNDPNKTHLA